MNRTPHFDSNSGVPYHITDIMQRGSARARSAQSVRHAVGTEVQYRRADLERFHVSEGFRRGSRALVYDVNEKGLQKKFIVPLIVSELAPAESSELEVAQERVALAGVARREVLACRHRPT